MTSPIWFFIYTMAIALIWDFKGVRFGIVMFFIDFNFWWKWDVIPLTTNPDAYISTTNSPWYKNGNN